MIIVCVRMHWTPSEYLKEDAKIIEKIDEFVLAEMREQARQSKLANKKQQRR